MNKYNAYIYIPYFSIVHDSRRDEYCHSVIGTSNYVSITSNISIFIDAIGTSINSVSFTTSGLDYNLKSMTNMYISFLQQTDTTKKQA